MRRIAICISLAWLHVMSPEPVWAEDDSTAEQTSADDTLMEQLNLAREGIVDPEARPEDRRRWIDALFSYDTPQARALVVELLKLHENPAAQQAICQGIARNARTHPHRLDKSFVEPLIELLGSSSENVRAAASGALADFPGAEVVVELGALAGRSDVAMDRRLAAIDAMVSKVDSRAVVRELMALLEADVPEITAHVVAALEPVSRETFGADLERWGAWWKEKSALDEEAWLTDRLHLYRGRVHSLQRELDSAHALADRRHSAMSARTSRLQWDLFHSLGPDQKQAKLAEWLVDPLPEIILVSLDLIRARMADEGQRPQGEVLLALVKLLSEGTPAISLAVLEIVQNLKNEPSVVQAVLAQVAGEAEPEVRHALIKALGRLDSPEAVPTLVLEIASPHSSQVCVGEAAIALGRIAAGGYKVEPLDDALDALKSRYKLASGDGDTLRAALLTAMAGVGDPAFAPEFLDAIESDSASVVRPAMRGLRAIADNSKLPRFRTLTAHTDPLVRVAAVQAVGELGGQDADLESVLTRLNPTIETSEPVREAAWTAFQDLLADKPLNMQLTRSERLSEMPDLETRYLQALVTRLATVNGNGIDGDAVYDRLARALVSQGKHADALPHLRHLYEGAAFRAGDGTQEIGLRWLEAALWASEQGDVAGIIARLVTEAGDDDTRAEIVRTVVRHVESPAVQANAERTRTLLVQLRLVESEVLGEEWAEMLQRVADRTAGTDTETAPSASP